ncbi:hypoxanthine phosphoribosyltransferase [Methylacidimicrobium cyclopophantes]|uniref:Hypoxanthine phosphoribosyltransferase n=1 Tax=Methylacidimicrobium cyclopophantes TaxID=1041766 RepID=A0A5E6MFX4_9BACT|nr:phosphoribosyltransferase family protein [Methylacidimicrobium cyclopophantes]VVM06753.1 hypoxanthine phosphoribosyltransferase [Methylacidimicrobium cyclopophantes]
MERESAEERLESEIGRLLLSEEAIRQRVKALGADIRTAYSSTPFTLLGLLNGSLLFTADLLRELPPETEVLFWRVQSYRGTVSTGFPEGLEAERGDFAGRAVLVVDDILDSGCTLLAVEKRLRALGACKVDYCVLLAKRRARTAGAPVPRWIGFEIPDRFVIGYGLDYEGRYRGLRSIRVLAEETVLPEK